MNKSLAMMTYEMLGAVEFKSLVEKLNDEQINNLFGDSSYVNPEDRYKEGAVYVAIGIGEDCPEWVYIFEDEYKFYSHRNQMNQEFDFFCLGSRGVDVSGLGTGSKYEIYNEDLILEGVGVKVGANGWQETGTIGFLDNCEVAKYLVEDNVKFYNENGERIFNE